MEGGGDVTTSPRPSPQRGTIRPPPVVVSWIAVYVVYYIPGNPAAFPPVRLADYHVSLRIDYPFSVEAGDGTVLTCSPLDPLPLGVERLFAVMA